MTLLTDRINRYTAPAYGIGAWGGAPRHADTFNYALAAGYNTAEGSRLIAARMELARIARLSEPSMEEGRAWHRASMADRIRALDGR